MENNKKNIADTMEINSILEEHRRNRNQSTQNSGVSPAQSKPEPVKNTQQQKPNSIEDDFVIYDDDKNTGKKEKKAKNPKAKKTAILVTVISLVLVIVAAAGFGAYKMFSEFKYANNIYVNDIAIGSMTYEQAKELLTKEEAKIADNINVVVKAEEKSTTLNKDSFTYTFTTDEVLEQAKQYTKDNLVPKGEQRYNIAIRVDSSGLDEVSKAVSMDVNQDPLDAVVTKFDSSKKGSDKFTIEDSKTGIVLKNDEFEQQLVNLFASGEVSGVIDAEIEKTEPKYTKEYLLNNLKKLSTFSTTSTNNANGNANMKLSLSQCNNSIINPGETWSFNKCTGDSNLTSNGYKPAGVIVNGKHETGVGGGICQSSTTIYNATMLCGMEVVERSCHYYKSTYVDAGRDATVDYGNLDLKVKNPFEYQLFMECYMDGTKLYCNMYGLENEEFDEIKITSSVTSYFSRGFKAQTTRTFYLDGKKVKSESLPNSTYYTSAPDSGSTSSKKSSKKPSSSKPEQENEATQAPTPTPDPEPTPTPDPEPTPTPDPEPTPTPDPTPDPVDPVVE
ncbi:MAG: VanW family protein [Ruminococcus sp.]|nr:VanW family protein [Ruminococcus sp.]